MQNREFRLSSTFKPSGDQPEAIELLTNGLLAGYENQTLLGVTGSGKTFTIANVVCNVQKPALLIAPNKTLAAQLYNELKAFLPGNAVEYFISYYDYYQPEAYIPRSDVYIEKSASINEEIDRLRHSATRSLFERNDVLVVASVSCIYGLGEPENYFRAAIKLDKHKTIDRDVLLRSLVDIHYTRNDLELQRGTFRVKGDTVEIRSPYDNYSMRVEFFGDDIEKIQLVEQVNKNIIQEVNEINIYPAVHYITSEDIVEQACIEIEKELALRLGELNTEGKMLEANRLLQRTNYDLEMIREVGYCNGIENYSRIFDQRPPGSPPATLLDYFPDDFLLLIDESHITIPQIRGMYNGDRSRKQTLVDYGFRLPSALDNRPLKFDEFWQRTNQRIFISATPSDFERSNSDQIVEQIIRPTGLVDPEVIIHKTENQVDDLLKEIRKVIKKGERVLITTLTKRMSEDLTDYLKEFNVRVKYLHSEIKPIDRVEILRDLRLGNFDVLVGVNLLREGLDLPEVSLVAILDADKEGFLRSTTSLIQIIGRAARNACGRVILYADHITDSIKNALDETNRRRTIQIQYNEDHNITPQTIKKDVANNLLTLINSFREPEDILATQMALTNTEIKDINRIIEEMELQMYEAADVLDFERAAELRDKLKQLQQSLENRKSGHYARHKD
jgi:excinuclease ABC subunit B